MELIRHSFSVPRLDNTYGVQASRNLDREILTLERCDEERKSTLVSPTGHLFELKDAPDICQTVYPVLEACLENSGSTLV
jgi:hypothetical protein